MAFDFTNFHFARAELLWLLLLVGLFLLGRKFVVEQKSNWQQVIAPHLLKFLSAKSQTQSFKQYNWLIAITSILIIIAISGPSFREQSVPVFENKSAQVILLDLSLSMDATDIKPSRLERAKFKLLDLLNQTNEGTVGLVVYAGDAFVISPLTSDAKTIINMVPTLSTGIMPVLGSRPDIAIEQSIALLENAKYFQGQIIWLTDGVEKEFADAIIESINKSGYGLSILAIGTEQGAPIPLPDKSGFLKDASGSIVVPKLQTASLQQIAENTGAGIIELTADSQDIDYLIRAHQLSLKDRTDKADQKINQWIDDGYWLLWLVAMLFGFYLTRQTSVSTIPSWLVASFLVFGVASLSSPAKADGIKDWLLTPNQQAKSAYQDGDYEKAAELFEDKDWRAAAQYQSGAYADAAKNYSSDTTEQSLYNYATSLAKGNNLKEALEAYQKLLDKNPNHEDGQFNKKIVEDLLKQEQENQQQDQENNEDNQQQDQQNNQQDQQNSEEQDEQQAEKQEQQQPNDNQEKQQQQEQQKQQEDNRDKSEKDQALEHWLEKIPDDPGGLLRRKMYREYQRRGRQQKEEKVW